MPDGGMKFGGILSSEYSSHSHLNQKKCDYLQVTLKTCLLMLLIEGEGGRVTRPLSEILAIPPSYNPV